MKFRCDFGLCTSADWFATMNLPGDNMELLEWVAEHGEVAMRHIDRAIDTGMVDAEAFAEDLMREGVRDYLRNAWLVWWEYRTQSMEAKGNDDAQA